MELDKRIEKFILKHHVLTLATVAGAEPYCSNMFYVYMPEHKSFVFTSSDDTRHVSDMLSNQKVAASIVLETTVVGKLQGAQMQGVVSRASDEIFKSAYIKKYPFAALTELNLWALELDFVKFTDNRLGFGRKLIYRKDE